MESHCAGILFKTKKMISHEILKANIVDIVFENRNKAYGAYELRTHYNNRLWISLVTMLCAISITVLIVNTPSEKIAQVLSSLPKREPVIVRIPRDPVPPVLQPIAVRLPKADMAREKFVDNFKIVPDIEQTDFPERVELVTAAISSEQNKGNPALIAEPPYVSISEKGSDGNNQTSSLPDGFIAVEKTANFPGGQKAWLHFLNRHLRSPEELEAGQKTYCARAFCRRN